LKKLISYLVLTSLIVIAMSGSLFITPTEKAAAYDRNLLCTDSGLTNFGSLNAAGIQEFLVSKGSFLKSYSQGGRSAAQIIYNAALENGINPIAILAMIQKEEGLITGTYSTSLNQTRLDWAMGYGYTDSIIYSQYRGFTNQINYGTWQLRYNYNNFATNGGVWNVGKTMNIDGTNVTFGNKCTSSQYRYTPHLGVNFMNYFDAWGGNNPAPAYQAQYVSETHSPTITNGDTKTLTISYRNTGSQTWRRGVVNLGIVNTDYSWRLNNYNMAYNWFRTTRPATLDQASVAPGAIGTFTFKVRNNNDAPGNHRLDVGLVAEGIQWFSRNTHAYWDVFAR